MNKTIVALALALFLVGCTGEPSRTGARSADRSASPPAETVVEPLSPAPQETGQATPRDREDGTAAILVSEPAIGERVSSPVKVEGTADVFEATVQMRLLDAQGKRLARAFTTASCGSGCRGDFSHALEFTVETEQRGVLEVWWDSPEDGSRKDVVRIAVTLAP